jgi:hypothetical protein
MINATDQPQTIYKNTFAAMAETIPDQNIINKFPLSTQHPEISVFNETIAGLWFEELPLWNQ